MARLLRGSECLQGLVVLQWQQQSSPSPAEALPLPVGDAGILSNKNRSSFPGDETGWGRLAGHSRGYPRLFAVPLSPQADTSSLSGDNTLMSTLEEKETDGEQGPATSPAPADEPSSPLLSPGCTSSSSAAKLLSPRRTRPRLGGRGRPGRAAASQAEAGPPAHPRSLEGLRLPSVPWNVPPDLSPR